LHDFAVTDLREPPIPPFFTCQGDVRHSGERCQDLFGWRGSENRYPFRDHAL